MNKRIRTAGGYSLGLMILCVAIMLLLVVSQTYIKLQIEAAETERTKIELKIKDQIFEGSIIFMGFATTIFLGSAMGLLFVVDPSERRIMRAKELLEKQGYKVEKSA